MRPIELQGNGLPLQIIWRADGGPDSHRITASAPGELDDDDQISTSRLEHLGGGVDHPHSAPQVGGFAIEHGLYLFGKVVLQSQGDIQAFLTEETFLDAIDQAHVTAPGNDIDHLRASFDGLEAWRHDLAEWFRLEVFDLARGGLRTAYGEQQGKS